MEEAILKFWKENDIFSASLSNREQGKPFIFYDGPPFATGLPHFGHLVPSTLKDIIPRYKTMKGFKVERRWGWDTHGLPVEYEVERELNLKSQRSTANNEVIERFNTECRKIVLRYSSQWEEIIERLGRWVDFKNSYTTMDRDYIESVWWVFKQLLSKDLVYQGYYILPYSPQLASPLSNFEVSLGLYKEVHDPALTVKFPLEGKPNVFFLAWTTTPWTLPTNLALALNEEILYSHIRIKHTQEEFILGKARLDAYFQEKDYEILRTVQGKDLQGTKYLAPFEYYERERSNGAFQVLLSNYVTQDDGTAIMHVAPFGEEDYNLLKKTKINIPCPLDEQCQFNEELPPPLTGLFVKKADKEIIRMLEEKKLLFKKEVILHRYPHCYRSGCPLIYRPVCSWFVKVSALKDKMLINNENISWHPSHLQRGRFGKWLENARDWGISRNRFWGNPIPIWQCDKSLDTICVGSFEELEYLSGKKIEDPHRPFIDEITWPSPKGGTYRRVKEVFDCWFESGAMPYAQQHYPFEKKQNFYEYFPAHFIAEGLDQTRGWFYTLMVLSTALFNQAPFLNVMVNGLVLANDGKKMSKSLRNYTDPSEIMHNYGADALRLYLISSPVIRAEDLKFSNEGVKEVLKSILIPFWNAYSFFVIYANIDNYKPSPLNYVPSNPLDAWILSEIESLTDLLNQKMDNYELASSVEILIAFIDNLNNWYIRRSRRRFWRSENDKDKIQAYDTLYYVLKKFITLCAPFIPFVSEEIYQNLRQEGEPLSVHLCDYPHTSVSFINQELEEKMALIQKAIGMGRTLRNTLNIKNRQPLNSLYLISKNVKEISILREMEDILLEELNVKNISFQDNEEELVSYRAKANFKVLGKTLGPRVKEVAREIAQLNSSSLASLLSGCELAIDLEGEIFHLSQESIIIEREEKSNFRILNCGSLTIGFDTEITQELLLEGKARDLIRHVQNLRKEKGFKVTDKIILAYRSNHLWSKTLNQFKQMIMGETLSLKITNLSEEKLAPLTIDNELFLDIYLAE
ncbi:UNVERIFIED_CONTAM: hypothetical protein PYX00_010981 [Menopon gallinae]|uniref:isoleucine--tRNA ligase n=1 Tax=Menopon gallinae TaxID=328185 RepID=A0AAW2H6V9_9NEOP